MATAAAALPAHLGWGSPAATAVARRSSPAGLPAGGAVTNDLFMPGADQALDVAVTSDDTPVAVKEPVAWVKLYPDIGLGLLQQGMTAPGRLWLLLRGIDEPGSGVLRIDNLVNALTITSSPLHLCGKRQLRNLLKSGEHIFWVRDAHHLWLRSAANVAVALGVTRLTGYPVALPLTALLGGIGDFRAHLYAAFHSGRTQDRPTSQQTRQTTPTAMPIARQTLLQLSGVGASSQRTYESRLGLSVQANFAIGQPTTEEAKETHAWRQGQALFALQDFCGQQGKKGKTYLAWQLPNSYIGRHPRQPKGRQKRINRLLKNDLVMKGMPGNVAPEAAERREVPKRKGQGLDKVYYPHGKLAAKAYGRDPATTRYWRWQKTRHGRFVMWQQVGVI